jgi:cytochrome c-type biogenesis protein CcmH/NrfG
VVVDVGAPAAGGFGSGTPHEIGDDGMADAELALEAMQSFRLAEAALQRNDVAAARQLAQKAVDADPMQVDYLSLLAWIKALDGNPAAVEDGIAMMTEILGDDPANERALLYRGKLFVRTNRFQEAFKDLSDLAAANPHNLDAQHELELVKSRLG